MAELQSKMDDKRSGRPSASKAEEEVIFGPMFSGKTTELIRRLKRYQIANYRCLIVKYANDDRYSANSISTHDMQTLPATITKTLTVIDTTDYDVIGIDEGQFFLDIVQFCEASANTGKVIIVAALDGTYQKAPFGDILNLVPLAESVIKLNAVCMNCFKDACYTKRISNEKELEVIGGADKYMAVCRECFQLDTTKKSKKGNKNGTENKINVGVLLCKENVQYY